MTVSQKKRRKGEREKGSKSEVPGSLSSLLLLTPAFSCRSGCGACCIAPSISSPIPGMPGDKPAGVRCVQLSDDNLCKLFGLPERPAVCAGLQPGLEMCGDSAEEALAYLGLLERLTRPNSVPAE